MVLIRQSEALLVHLREFELDGATVGSSLFEGGRLSYPERRRLEHELGFIEPYTLQHEACVIDGMDRRWNAACRFLARIATRATSDPTLDLLWGSHDAFSHAITEAGPQAIDRLVAALVTINMILEAEARSGTPPSATVMRACEVLIVGLQAAGFPPSAESIEELSDGAVPACVGLGLVDIDWRERP